MGLPDAWPCPRGETVAQVTALAIAEKEWTAQIVEIARATGFRRYHTYRSKRSESGWP